jgi:acyl-CoA reductase-like NAD-dependent aldehyde dehydrogenase
MAAGLAEVNSEAMMPWRFQCGPLPQRQRALVTVATAPPAAGTAASGRVPAQPAEDTPLTLLALSRLAEEAGLQAGVPNMAVASRDPIRVAQKPWLPHGCCSRLLS